MRKFAVMACVLLLSACGSAGPLQWPGGSPPPAPEGQEAAQTADEMLVPPPQAAPERIDDAVRNTDQRSEDPFDLPPT